MSVCSEGPLAAPALAKGWFYVRDETAILGYDLPAPPLSGS
jgi:hypothetical protein